MAKVDKKCVECGEVKTKKAKARNIYLCGECIDMDKYKLISKTQIEKLYFITEDDLVGCISYIVKQGMGYPNATLYIVSDVKDKFCFVYNVYRNNDAINHKMQELKENKERISLERKKRIAERKINSAEKRKTNLVNALKEYNLNLRNDSKLCNGYIDGTIEDWTIKQIVHRMCQMKYLYDYCNMDECCAEAYEEQQEEYRAGYFPDCTVFEQAELIALDRYGKYPDVWPWLKNK